MSHPKINLQVMVRVSVPLRQTGYASIPDREAVARHSSRLPLNYTRAITRERRPYFLKK